MAGLCHTSFIMSPPPHSFPMIPSPSSFFKASTDAAANLAYPAGHDSPRLNLYEEPEDGSQGPILLLMSSGN